MQRLPLCLNVTAVESGMFLFFGGLCLTTLLGWLKMPFLHIPLDTVSGRARTGSAVRFSTTPEGSVLQWLSHRILFDTQEATWGEEIYFFLLLIIVPYLLMPFFFLILHHALIGRVPQTAGHWAQLAWRISKEVAFIVGLKVTHLHHFPKIVPHTNAEGLWTCCVEALGLLWLWMIPCVLAVIWNN